VSTTEIDRRNGGAEMLFAGATPHDVIAAATEVANEFREVVRQQRLFAVIAGREHVLIEGWQTCASLAGVAAIKDSGVLQIPWPELGPLPEEPPEPGHEPRRSDVNWQRWREADTARKAWESHRDLISAHGRGLAYGFSASWRVVRDGRDVGWGEGRCTRGERTWANRDDYALASQAQTRGQSRALAAPLRFIVKLAGYATTPADEMSDGEAPVIEAAPLLDAEGQADVVKALQEVWREFDAHRFMTVLGRRLDGGIPEAVGVALRAWAWWAKDAPGASGNAAEAAPENVPPDAADSAYHQPPQ
jgi:hypothetical protein